MMDFRAGNGKWLTKALFFETSLLGETRQHARYTLKEEDHTVDGVVYKSLKKLFLECGDATEYEFATTYLGGWNHWKVMQKVKDLQPYIEDWRDEYSVKLRALGVKKIIERAKSSEAGFQDAKWLADKQWIENARGRPSKAEVKKNAKEMAKVKNRLSGDVAKLKDFRNARKK